MIRFGFQMKVAEKAVDAMHRVHGTIYEPGRAPEMMCTYTHYHLAE